MLRMILAVAAALALVTAGPAFANCPDCKNCPQHKVAAADTAEKKEGDKKPGCACTDAKDCKCGAKCACPNCHAKHENKEEPKKT